MGGHSLKKKKNVIPVICIPNCAFNIFDYQKSARPKPGELENKIKIWIQNTKNPSIPRLAFLSGFRIILSIFFLKLSVPFNKISEIIPTTVINEIHINLLYLPIKRSTL